MRRTFAATTHFALAGERLLAAASLDPRTVRTTDLPVRPEHGAQCGSGDDVDRCATCHRQYAGGLKTAERMRFVYAQPRSRTGTLCVICHLPGAWNLPRTHAARLEAGHVISCRNYGAANARNLLPMHRACNAAAGDRDLRPFVPEVTSAWPTGAAAAAYEGTPWHLYVPAGVDALTASDLAAARRARVIYADDGAVVTLPF